jgi:hypothetical protein
MKTTFLLVIAIVLCATVAGARADDSSDAARARVAAAQKKLDDLRDHATASDYQTVGGATVNGRAQPHRVPTPEFAARIEQAQKELDAAQAELKHPQRSLY